MIPVEDRSSATLIHITKEWIRPGSLIISDCWKAYEKLGEEVFHYLTVNHNINFVDQKWNLTQIPLKQHGNMQNVLCPSTIDGKEIMQDMWHITCF